MAKTKQEKQQATAKRIARDNLRLAMSHLESDDYTDATRAASAATDVLAGLVRAQNDVLIRARLSNHAAFGISNDPNTLVGELGAS
jgi:hypothetical protein